MLSQPVLAAVTELQQQALQATDLYEIDRIERSLDEILRKPDNPDPAAFQVRSARAHAHQVLRDRRRIVGIQMPMILDTNAEDEFDVRVVRGFSGIEGGYDVVEFETWLLATVSLSARERSLLRALGDGEDATSLAAAHNRPIRIMSQRLSRARRSGRKAYDAEVRSA